MGIVKNYCPPIGSFDQGIGWLWFVEATIQRINAYKSFIPG